MPLLLWASASEDLLATAGGAPALRLRIPGRALPSQGDEVARPGALQGWLLRLPGQVFVSTRGRLGRRFFRDTGRRSRARVSRSRRDARVHGNSLPPGHAAGRDHSREKRLAHRGRAWLDTGPSMCRCRESRRGGREIGRGQRLPQNLIVPAQTATGEGSNGLGARARDHRPADRKGN